MTRIPLNKNTTSTGIDGRARRFFLQLNAAGKPVVVADRGLNIDPAIFAQDRYGDFPADAKRSLPGALLLLAA